ncbi:MAG: alpha/beta hydrolase [Melioribacteraceae bacterium]|nr:MAG: alpha/beta hydrolase [Melioribacteraceae bacterium]
MNTIQQIAKYFFKLIILGSLFFMKVESAEIKTDIFEEKIEIVNGLKVNYRIAGNGLALLFLHGYTLSGKLWDPFIEKLSQNFTVIIPDLPGHGKSDEVKGKYTFEKFAEVMIGLLDQLDVSEVNVVGHSGGGMTILNMVKQKPGLVKTMTLIGCAHKFTKEGIEFTKHDTFENLSEELKVFYREIHPNGDTQTKKLFDQMFPLLLAYNNFDIYSKELEESETRSLIIMGDKDYYFKPEYAVEMFNALPNSQLWIVPNQGHLPFREDWGGSEAVERIFVDEIEKIINSNKPSVNLGLN